MIELLVVITIIALLAAILFPVFSRARENGRRSSCQSNLKQLGLGFIQYSQDWDEYIPRYQYGTCCTPNTQSGWYDSIYPYVKSVQVYNCPSAGYGKISQGTKRFAVVSSTYTNTVTGMVCLTTNTSTTTNVPAYSANRNYYNRYASGINSTPFHTSADQKLPAMTTPATTILLTDYMSLATASSNGTTLDGSLTAAEGTPGYEAVYLHLDTSNALFADGHVKAYTQDRLTETHKVAGVDIAYLFTMQDD